MIDSNLFKYVIRKNGDSMNDLAIALGLSRTSLSLKINNRSDFKLSEVQEISKRYNLTVEQGIKLFLPGVAA